MKKIIASVGMVVVGTTGLQAVNYGDIQPDQASKRWSVSAAVRGFYDDNYTTRPAGDGKSGSAGFEVSPSVAFNLPMETSFLGLTYVYTMSYYDHRQDNKVDQSHDAKLSFDHRFNERYHMSLNDQFVYSVEPTLLNQGGTVTTPLRSKANGFHNRFVLASDLQLTPLWSLAFGSENNYYNYEDHGAGSYSSQLDRDEILIHIDPRYAFSPNTTGFFGYQFGKINYLSDDAIEVGGSVKGEDRDNTSHYLYVGAEQKFSSTLSAEGRVGVQFIDYNKLDDNTTSPYLDVLGTYNYVQGSYLKLGVKYAHNATDVSGSTKSDVTLDQETLTVYLSVNHRITALLSAGLLVQYQNSTYNGGQYDGDADNYVSSALSLSYKLNRNWSIEATYYLDSLSSDIPGRDFTRNREFLGIRGTY